MSDGNVYGHVNLPGVSQPLWVVGFYLIHLYVSSISFINIHPAFAQLAFIRYLICAEHWVSAGSTKKNQTQCLPYKTQSK